MTESNSIKNFSFVGIGRLITMGLTAIFYLVIAALLEPDVYGKLNVIVALAGTFSIISLFGLNLSFQVYSAKEEMEISKQIITLFVIATTAAALILVVFDPLASLLCLSLSFFTMTQSYLLGLSQYKKYMIFSILKSIAFFVIPLLLFFVFDIYGIVFGMVIGNFIGSIPFFTKIKIKSVFGLRNYYRVLIHNFGVQSGSQLPLMVDKLMIAPFFGLFVVGVYQFNLQIMMALGILPGILGQYLISEESKGIGHRKLSLLVIIASILLVLISIVLAPILVPIFYPKYSDGIESLQIMVISVIPQSIGIIYGAKLLAKESTKVGYLAVVTVGSLLILLAVLGQWYELKGLALAVLISMSAGTLFAYYLYRDNISQKIK